MGRKKLCDEYWENEVKFQIESFINDADCCETGKKLEKLSEERIKIITKRVAKRVLRNDWLWEQINNFIDSEIQYDLIKSE